MCVSGFNLRIGKCVCPTNTKSSWSEQSCRSCIEDLKGFERRDEQCLFSSINPTSSGASKGSQLPLCFKLCQRITKPARSANLHRCFFLIRKRYFNHFSSFDHLLPSFPLSCFIQTSHVLNVFVLNVLCFQCLASFRRPLFSMSLSLQSTSTVIHSPRSIREKLWAIFLRGIHLLLPHFRVSRLQIKQFQFDESTPAAAVHTQPSLM